MADYLQELDWADPKTVNIILSELKRILIKELSKEFMRRNTYPAKIISVNGDTADIILENGVNTIQDVKNKSGEVLSPNDEVYIEAINGSLNNIVIKYKK